MELNDKLEYIREALNTIIDILVIDKPSGFLYIEKVLFEYTTEYNDWCIQKSPMDEIKVVLSYSGDEDGFAIEWIASEKATKETIEHLSNFLDSEFNVKEPYEHYDVDIVYARLVELFKYSDEELRIYLKLK